MALDKNSWKFEVRRLPHLDDLQLLHVSDVTHDYPRHVHEEYCIAMILRGSETHTSRGLSYTAFQGDLLLLNAGEAHSNRSVCVEYKSIQIHPRFFSRASENNGTPFFAEPVVTDPKLFQSFLNLYSTLQRNASPLEQKSEFASTIDMLFRDPTCEPASASVESIEPSCITRVRNHLKKHYSENVSLSRLASIANLST